MKTETAMEVEQNKENETDNSDMEATDVVENGTNGIEETLEDDDSKYTDEDKPRRVIVKNIDFKATAEEIEDFFGSEKFQSIEHVSKKFTARGTWKEKKEGKALKKRFNGVVIITFEDKESADKFIAMENLTLKDRKLRKHSLTESEERREKFLEQKKAKIEATKKKKKEEKKAALAKKKKDEKAQKIPEEENKSMELEEGASIKIAGIANKHTKIKDIRDKLKASDVKYQDIVYVNFENGNSEAQIRLKGDASNAVAELIKKLNNRNILMGDEIMVSKLIGTAERELAKKAKEHLAMMPSKKKL